MHFRPYCSDNPAPFAPAGIAAGSGEANEYVIASTSFRSHAFFAPCAYSMFTLKCIRKGASKSRIKELDTHTQNKRSSKEKHA